MNLEHRSLNMNELDQVISMLKFKERKPTTSNQAQKNIVKDQIYNDVKVQSTVYFGTKSREGTMSNVDKVEFDIDKEQKH